MEMSKKEKALYDLSKQYSLEDNYSKVLKLVIAQRPTGLLFNWIKANDINLCQYENLLDLLKAYKNINFEL
jgi:hypothetical protein